MRRIAAIFAVSAFLSLCTGPAFAQYGGMPNPSAFDRYLNNHPNQAAELRSNPGLIYNPNWRHQHPELQEFLQKHPGDWHAMEANQGAVRGRGWWGPDYSWHDQNWWAQNNPNWVRENHPDWGDWDERHEWHDRDWWADNHPDWVRDHHADWLAHHEAVQERHEEHKEWKEEHHHGHGHDSDYDHDNDHH